MPPAIVQAAGPCKLKISKVEIVELRQFTVEAIFPQPESSSNRLDLYPPLEFPEDGQKLGQLAEIGARTATIVHEMRNPLTTVLMGLSSCQRMVLSKQAEQRLILALEEAERLQRLIDDILLYAKPLALQRHDLELNDLIQEILDSSLLPAALERKIDFVCPSCAIWIKGDRDRLKQIFMNLLNNACEAVTLDETIAWEIEADAAANLVWVRLRNGGRQIEPEALPQITQPFFTTKPDGNGLGLAIVKHLVEAHGGELAIESSMAGTTASVCFPIVRLIKPTVGAIGERSGR